MDADVIVIGAGAAGLAAARELSAARLKVIILDARDRIGGRIHTHFDKWPIELGAEFVHGKPPETFAIAERANLKLQSIPNLHWHFHDGVLTKSGEFWSKVEDVMDEMSRYRGADQSFDTFLAQYNRSDITGEATNKVGHHGTVHGALWSGLRAANEILGRVTLPQLKKGT